MPMARSLTPVHIHPASAAARPHTGRPAPLAWGGTVPVAVSALLLAELVPGWISQSHTHSPESLSAHIGGSGAWTMLEKGGGGCAPDRSPGDNAQPQAVLAVGTDPSRQLPQGSADFTLGELGAYLFLKGKDTISNSPAWRGLLQARTSSPGCAVGALSVDGPGFFQGLWAVSW